MSHARCFLSSSDISLKSPIASNSIATSCATVTVGPSLPPSMIFRSARSSVCSMSSSARLRPTVPAQFRRPSRTPQKNVWRAPLASGFRRHGLTSLLQRIRSRDQFSRPRWRSAHSGPNKPCRRRYAIFLTRVPEYRSTVRPSRFPPPANLRRSISA